MKGVVFVKYLLTVAALYLCALGLALLIVPVQFGVDAVPRDASPALIALLRLMAGPFLGVAVLNWTSRNDASPLTLKPVLVANLVGFAVVAGNDIVGVITGDARELARVFVVVHLAFAGSFLTAWMRTSSALATARP